MLRRLLCLASVLLPAVAMAQTPYGGSAVSIPGRVEAERYDIGGEGVAYHDTDTTNTGGQFRADGVDIGTCTDIACGYSVSGASTEWLKYGVNVSTTAIYKLIVRASGTGTVHVEIDGVNVTGALPVSSGASWTNLIRPNVYLTAGAHSATLVTDSGSPVVNWIELSSPQTPYGGTIRTIPGRIEAEDYDVGGEGLSFHESNAGTGSTPYRTETVALASCNDTGCGYAHTGAAIGNWTEYTVNVTTSAYYRLNARVANTGALHVEVDDRDVTGTLTVTTGSTTVWQTLTKDDIYLSAGVHVLRVLDEVAGIRANWIELVNPQTPYGGTVRSVPATIQAEDYDLGGLGIAYYLGTGNAPTAYRSDGQPLSTCTGVTGCGYALTAGFAWAEYSVNATQAGMYTVNASLRTNTTNGIAMHAEVDGIASSSVNVTNTANAWGTQSLSVYMAAGIHRFRFVANTSNLDLNQLAFVYAGAATTQPTVLLSAPADAAVVAPGATITLSATGAVATGRKISRIEFFSGQKLLFSDTASPYTYTWSQSIPGVYQITAKITDSTGVIETSAPATITVQNQPPSTWLTAPAAGATIASGTTIALTADSSDFDGSVARVEFYNGSTLLGTSTTAPYSYSWTNVPSGNYSLRAMGVDNLGAVFWSNTAAIVVNTPPTVSLTAPTNLCVAEPASTTISANATDTDGTITKVEFYNGSTLLATDTSSPYSYAWLGVTRGTYSLYAKAYDNLGAVTTAGPLSFKSDIAPTVSISTSNTAPYIAGSTMNLSASASDGDGTISKVEFYNGATLLGTDTTAPFTFAWTNVPGGAASLKAVAYDNCNVSTTSSPLNVPFDVRPTVSWISPTSNQEFNTGASVSLAASASDSDGSVIRVDFNADFEVIATDNSSPYTASWTCPSEGLHTLSAVAYDNFGVSGTSKILINCFGSAPLVVELTSPAPNSHVRASSRIQLAANAPIDASIIEVRFYNGDQIGTSSLQGTGAAPYSMVANPLPAGTYSFTAAAVDDSDTVVATSAPRTVTVTDAPAAGSIISPAPGGAVAASTPFAIVPSVEGITTDIAKVEYYDGALLIGTATDAPFGFVWAGAPAGSHSLTAKTYAASGTITSAAVNIGAAASQNTPPSVVVTTDSTPVLRRGYTAITAQANDPEGALDHTEIFVDGVLVLTGGDSVTALVYLSCGTHSIVAYAYDTQGLAGATQSTLVVQACSSPAMQLTVSPSSVIDTMTTATLIATTEGGAAPWESVTFYERDRRIGRVDTPAVLGDYGLVHSLPWQVPFGRHPVKAVAFRGNVAAIADIEVVSDLAPQATLLEPTATTYPFEQQVPMRLTATDPDGSVDSIDSVVFTFAGAGGSSPAFALTTDDNLTYAGLTTGLPPGTYQVTSEVTDHTGRSTVSSPAVTVNVANTPPTVDWSIPAEGAVFKSGVPISLRATSPAIPTDPVSIEFFDGALSLGSDGVAPYEATLSNAAPGVHTLRAVATDSFGAKTETLRRITISTPPSLTILDPVDGAVYVSPVSLHFQLSTVDPGSELTTFKYFDGSTQVTCAPTNWCTWENIPLGPHSLTAVGYDSTGHGYTSPAVGFTVIQDQVPTATLTAPLATDRLVAGSIVTVAATASDSDGQVRRVEFRVEKKNDPNTVVASVDDTAAPYAFDWATTAALAGSMPAPMGTFTIKARAVDDRGAPGAWSSVDVTLVANSTPTVSLTSPSVAPTALLNVDGLSYYANTFVSGTTNGQVLKLSADVSDIDANVASVDFYLNEVKPEKHLALVRAAAPGQTSFAAEVPITSAMSSPGFQSVIAVVTDALQATTQSIAAPIAIVQPGVTTKPCSDWPNCTVAYSVQSQTTTFADLVRIQAERYDGGGAGMGYFKASPRKTFGSLSTERSSTDDVVEKCDGDDNGCWIGDFRLGEMLEYTIDVTHSDSYYFKGVISQFETLYKLDTCGKSGSSVSLEAGLEDSASAPPPASYAEFIADGKVVATAAIAEGRFYGTWANAPAGQHKVRIRAFGPHMASKRGFERTITVGSTSCSVVASRQSAPQVVAQDDRPGLAIELTRLGAQGQLLETTKVLDVVPPLETDAAQDFTSLYCFNCTKPVTLAQGSRYIVRVRPTWTTTTNDEDSGSPTLGMAVDWFAFVPTSATLDTAISITSPADGSRWVTGASIPLKVDVTAPSAATVDYYYDGVLLPRTPTQAPPYPSSVIASTVGAHTITAKVFGTTKTSTANIVVENVDNHPPVVTLVAPTNGQSFAANASIALSATASDDDGTITRVDFSRNGTLLASVPSPNAAGQYQYTWPTVLQGTYNVVATAYDNQGAATTSTAAVITVGTPGPVASTVPDQPLSNNVAGEVAHDASVGALAGKAGVSGGAATYEVPIVVPPGRRGMEPKLALSYSSRAGNGIAGMGWSLSGLSSIHRCPSTPEQDGKSYVRAVEFSSYDKLCLDGQRLVLRAGSAVYGAIGASYATEIDSFARVTQLGGDLESPSSYFRVELKSGEVLYFGGNSTTASTARVTPYGAPAPLVWMLDRRVDRLGNYVKYNYDDKGNGETLLSSIVYTGFGSADGDRRVDLKYLPRPAGSGSAADQSSSYLAGGLTRQTQRLTTITTSVSNGSEKVREYRLNYVRDQDNVDTSTMSGRSLLRSITECGYDANVATCRPATTLSWQEGQPTYVFSAVTSASELLGLNATGEPLDSITYAPSADFNGDGIRETLWTVPLNTTPSTKATYLVSLGADRTVKWKLEVPSDVETGGLLATSVGYSADFNNDGKPELVGRNASHLTLRYWTGPDNPSSFADAYQTTVETSIPSGDVVLNAGDMDGDGRADLVIQHTDPAASCKRVVTVWKNAGTGAAPTGNFTPTASLCLAGRASTLGTWYYEEVSRVADFDGNGLPDIWITSVGDDNQGPKLDRIELGTLGPNLGFTEKKFANLFPLGAEQATAEELSWKLFSLWMDVNGDGLDDFVYARLEQGLGKWTIRLNKGNVRDDHAALGNRILTSSRAGIDICAKAGDCTTTWQPRYASRIKTFDYDGDGRAELLYPRSFASRVCRWHQPVRDVTRCPNAIQTQSTNDPRPNEPDQCYEFYYCPEDPVTDDTISDTAYIGTDGQHLPGGPDGRLDDISGPEGVPDGKIDFYDGDRIWTYGMYRWGQGGIDMSAYYMGALRFVETGPGMYAAVTVETSIIAGAGSTKVDDVYGDGLNDVLVRTGCGGNATENLKCGVPIADESGIPYPSSNDPHTERNNSPHTLPNGDGVLSRKVYISEDIGAGRNGDGKTPKTPDLLSGVTDGLGVQTLWSYYPLSSAAARQPTETPLYRVLAQAQQRYVDERHIYFTSSMPVVSEMATSDVVGGLRWFQYGYEEAMYNTQGRGFQGFRTVIEEDEANGVRTTTKFNQKFPLAGQPEEVVTNSTKRSGTSAPIRRELYTWRCNRTSRTDASACTANVGTATVMFPFLDTQETWTYDAASADTLPGTPDLYDSRAIGHTLQINATSAAATASGYDANGNLVDQYVIADDGAGGSGGFEKFVQSQERSVHRTFEAPDTSRFEDVPSTSWWLDRLKNEETTAIETYASTANLPGNASNPSYVTFKETTWNSDRTLASEKLSQGSSAARKPVSTTTYGYPSYPNYGQPNKVTTTASKDLTSAAPPLTPARVTSTAYSPDGYFARTVTQDPGGALARSSTVVARERDGQPSSTTDPNGLTTTVDYDAFGRAIQVTAPVRGVMSAAPVKQSRVSKCTSCPNGFAKYVVTEVQDGAPTVSTYYDLMNRPVRAERKYVDGNADVVKTAFSEVAYNSRGLKTTEIETHAAGEAFGTTTYSLFDILGRPGKKVVTKGLDDQLGDLVTTYAYSGRKTSINVHGSAYSCPYTQADPGARHKCLDLSRVTDSFGRMAYTLDANGKRTSYWYDANGAAIAIQDVAGSVNLASYNAIGQRTSLNDPNMGAWSFKYDGFGEVLTETDARNITTTYTYDDLGRRLTRSLTADMDGGGAANDAVLDTWEYDPMNAIGVLRTETRTVNGAIERRDTHEHDVLGRRVKTTSNQFLAPGSYGDFVQSWDYDVNYGRVKAETYPTKDVRQLVYSRYGQVTSETEWTSGQALRTVDHVNGRGQVTAESYGNGVAAAFGYTGSTGQMSSANYTVGSGGVSVRKLAYGYDVFGDVMTQALDPNTANTTVETYEYDSLFRLKKATRTGLGTPATGPVTYDYDDAGNFRSKSDFASSYMYGGSCGAGKNAVTSVALTGNGGTGTRSYCYDGNGNLTSSTGGNEEFLATYGQNNLPSYIKRARNGVMSDVKLFYGASGEKVREVGSDGTRIQVGAYEKVSSVPNAGIDGTSEKAYFGDYAVLTRPSSGAPHFEWLLKDRLGSVEAVADKFGTLIEKRGSDAFGRPRGAGWEDTGKLASIGITPRGFTEHEHLNSLELIHMRGRAYDYNLGRFLSVDPIIQFPTNSQSLNPYSYVLNNPLAGTDPTGYAACMSAPDQGEECTLTVETTGSRISSTYTLKNVGSGADTDKGPGASGAVATDKIGGSADKGSGPNSPVPSNTTRAWGVLKMGTSVVAALGSAGGLAGCAESVGGGCVASGYLAFQAADYFQQGLNETWYGTPQPTLQDMGWQGVLGMSPQQSMMMQMATSGVAGSMAVGELLEKAPQALPPVIAPTRVPQGLSEEQFSRVSSMLRQGAGAISEDIFVHGSRAKGTAMFDSDIDFGIRVSVEQFAVLIRKFFGSPASGSAWERTMLRAVDSGKIQAGEAGLRQVRRALERELGIEVDVSIIKAGGKFDN